VADGYAVRGTTRNESTLDAIEAAGAEAVLADPDRLSTVLPQIEGVAVVCWLMGAAADEPRLGSFLGKLVDTQVRGFVYEVRDAVPQAVRAAERLRIPVELLEHDPGDHEGWLPAARAAVNRLLSPTA
jgi:hypothetical protein